jgi:hypothetical protein
VIAPLADWFSPLSSLAEKEDDPLLILAPYYQRLVEVVIPLVVGDMLTMRAWGWAKDELDKKPKPHDLVEWESRWRNFIGDVWRVVDQHLEREQKIERARAKRAKPAQGVFVLPARPVLEL